MNTLLCMVVYALNPKWYVEIPRRVPPINDPKVTNGYWDTIGEMYNEEEGAKLQIQFVQFAIISNPFNKPDTQANRIGLGTMN